MWRKIKKICEQDREERKEGRSEGNQMKVYKEKFTSHLKKKEGKESEKIKKGKYSKIPLYCGKCYGERRSEGRERETMRRGE